MLTKHYESIFIRLARCPNSNSKVSVSILCFVFKIKENNQSSHKKKRIKLKNNLLLLIRRKSIPYGFMKLNNLDTSKAPEPDSIKNKILKGAKYELSGILTHLFNLCFKTSFIHNGSMQTLYYLLK